MPIYDQPITKQDLRPLPKVSLSEEHKYVKDSCFQTYFTGKLTDKAIHQYCLQGRYGSIKQKEAEETEKSLQTRKNVKKLIKQQHDILVNKYVNI